MLGCDGWLDGLILTLTISPNTNPPHTHKIRYHKRWLYKEAADGTAEGGQVNVSRSATISKSVMLGQGTYIGTLYVGCLYVPVGVGGWGWARHHH